jgi:hypothetical protein
MARVRLDWRAYSRGAWSATSALAFELIKNKIALVLQMQISALDVVCGTIEYMKKFHIEHTETHELGHKRLVACSLNKVVHNLG